MFDYKLTIRTLKVNDLIAEYYCRIDLRADNRDEAITQANEIMNRFPEPTFKAELSEHKKENSTIFSWFN